MDTAELTAFVAVVRAGSFTRAAEQLGTQKAHLSRVVGRLEASLGVRLLHRSTRALGLTEVGREVYARAVGILEAIDETVALTQHQRGVPRGVLRVTCGVEFGLLAVNAWIAEYLGAHPEVSVESDYTNRVVDVIHEGFDVALRVGPLEASGLGARRLGEVHYGLFASPAYLRRRRVPRVPEDLASHALVLSTQTASPGRVWKLERAATAESEAETYVIRTRPRWLVTSHLAARDAVAGELGVALLPVFQARPLVASGALRRVLPGWGRPPAPVHAVFPSARYLTPKVRAFVETALAAFPRTVGDSATARGRAP